MKNTTKLLAGVALLSIGFAAGKLTDTQEIKATDENKQTINGQMVSIELWENKKEGYFDLIIEPIKNVNLSTEWDLNSQDNYKDAYLTGSTKERYESFYENNWKKQGIEYSWDK